MSTEENQSSNGAPVTATVPLRIAATHPALPGHFPGQPIVPAVVLLDAVLEAAQQWLRATVRLRTLTQAKFLAPLLPEQLALIELQRQGNELRFSIIRGEEALGGDQALGGTEAPSGDEALSNDEGPGSPEILAQGLMSVDAGVPS